VGDRLLKCLARDATLPRDVRDTVARYTAAEPEERRRGDLEDLDMDSPRVASRPTARLCLNKFEQDLIVFLKQVADPEGEQYLMRFQRLLRRAASRPRPVMRRRLQDNDYDDDDTDEDDDDERGLPWWAILLIILLVLAVLAAIIYGLYWFFRRRRLERRAIIAATAAGLSSVATDVAHGRTD
jgi:hypothetical protein